MDGSLCYIEHRGYYIEHREGGWLDRPDTSENSAISMAIGHARVLRKGFGAI